MSEKFQQACAVPYQLQNNHITFCLITSRSRGDWIFPKGNIAASETPQEAARKEAFEEAGLEGEIVADLGEFTYTKKGFVLLTSIQLIKVTHYRETWQEQDRQRCWVSPVRAQELIERGEMRTALQNATHWLSKHGQ